MSSLAPFSGDENGVTYTSEWGFFSCNLLQNCADHLFNGFHNLSLAVWNEPTYDRNTLSTKNTQNNGTYSSLQTVKINAVVT